MATGSVDPVTVSVIQHRLEAIVAEIGEVMFRTSYSQILNSSRDFSAAILSAEGRMVAQAELIPTHVAALPWAVKSVVGAFDGRIQAGDVFLLNDPYHGNNHLPDLTAFVPVFAGEELLYWSVNRSHQSDIGGSAHGGYNPDATEIWQEGIRIPPVRLFEAGALREDLLYLLQLNVRHPEDFRGDLLAMVGSARIGALRVQELLREHGADTLTAAVEAALDSAEALTRACIATWRDGTYRAQVLIDDDGHEARDIRVTAVVTKLGDSIEVDLSESDGQVSGFINSVFANTYSAVATALAFMIDPTIPKNDGTFRPLLVTAREGTVVWATSPAAVTLSTGHCSEEIVGAVLQALSEACPGRSLAGWSRRFRIALHGVDPRTERSFMWHMFHARGGGGASAVGDGWPTAGEVNSAGALRFESIEVTETRFPLFFLKHEFRPDSGGLGQFRGGAGSVMDLRVDADAVGNTAGDGVRHGAFGLFGGGPGLPHRYVLLPAHGEPRELKTKESGIRIHTGDVLSVESGGGGGWGPPARRTLDRTRLDFEDGFVRTLP